MPTIASRPFFDNRRQAWLLYFRTPDGKRRRITLGKDVKTAFEAWQLIQEADPEPAASTARKLRKKQGPKSATEAWNESALLAINSLITAQESLDADGIKDAIMRLRALSGRPSFSS